MIVVMKSHFFYRIFGAVVVGFCLLVSLIPAVRAEVSPGSATGATAGAANAALFVDVPADYEFREALQFFKEKKIIRGYPDQTFRPEAPVTRAEFLKMAMQLSGRTQDTTKMKAIYKDVAVNDWFFADVMTAHALAVASGYGDGNFFPNKQLTRVEALKLAFNALQFSGAGASGGADVSKKTGAGVAAEPLPPDLKTSQWFYSYAMTARKLFIMTDSDDGNFYPDALMNRGSAAEILYRVYQVKLAGGAAFDMSREWNMVSSPLVGMSYKVPKSWTVSGDGTVVRKKTAPFYDDELITPLNAKITFRRDIAANFGGSVSSAKEFFGNIRSVSQASYPGRTVEFTEVALQGAPTIHVKILSDGIENWFVYLPNGGAIVIYGRYGIGSLTPKLRETLRSMVRSMTLSAVSGDAGVVLENLQKNQVLKSDIQKKILVEKTGKIAIESIGDALVIETDEIGVGTGPVDYYFSAKIDMTLKYERGSDTILAVRSGKTTAF